MTYDYENEFTPDELALLQREAERISDPAEQFSELLGAAINHDATSALINSLSEVADADAVATAINNDPNYFH